MAQAAIPDLRVRLGETRDADDICRICETGFRFVTAGIVPADIVDRQVTAYYNPTRVSRETDPARFSSFWNGYVVAESQGQVVGAAGGGLDESGIGHLYVLYLDLRRTREGIGSLLLP